MAKQTFTTGQVLTAAQMTSLQQTAMGGGPATAKTANYVLVAADAGTTVAMDAATATTITVDTGLFAAGDTVFIQNIGAGDCTITAGTATVDTAGSLILPQYDAGILYFTSASAAIFYDYIQVGATSPLTTKGDLYTFGTSDTRLAVGTNGHTLVANSSTSTGLEWQAPASGGGMTLINTGGTALTGSTTTVSSIPTTYTDLKVYIVNAKGSADTGIFMRFNGDNAANRHRSLETIGAAGYNVTFNDTSGAVGYEFDNGTSNSLVTVQIPNYANTTTWKYALSWPLNNSVTTNANLNWTQIAILYNQTDAITSLEFFPNTGTFAGGTVYVYGVK